MIDIIVQIAIFILGASAIILVARKNKWGFVIGLLSQPFWFITSYQNQQWGIFLVGIIYTISWIYGIYEWFYKQK
jgi:nicotinamide riboside transporter PnuC